MTSLKESFRRYAPLPPEKSPEGMYDVCLLGSGMGSLSAAALLSKKGLKVAVLEQNYLPGGCSSSYWRKGFVFESGATTLVGLDEGMPLWHLLEETGIRLPHLQRLSLPMKVHLADGQCLSRHENMEAWIEEAERVFGKGQREFWAQCKRISDFVWETSLLQTSFPPSQWSDWLQCARRATWKQIRFAPWAFRSMHNLLQEHGLLQNQLFVDFINEQLLITAQNTMKEVNVLFGATALCYTNYGNYYAQGGLIHLVQPLVEYIQQQGGEVWLRTEALALSKQEGYYRVETNRGSFSCKKLLSGLPINNTLPLMQGEWGEKLGKRFISRVLPSEKLHSAFQMGVAFKGLGQDVLHHQVHLQGGSRRGSVFLSMSAPGDPMRSDAPGYTVASISTHVSNPAKGFIEEGLEEAILKRLDGLGLIPHDQIVYTHASTPRSWEQWTKRTWGFVGGYPQYMRIKPWQMLPCRLDGEGAFLCGDTAYPGQGIPGVVLSGIIAAEAVLG